MTGSVKPIPYYGGKQRLAKRIVDLLPAHTCYVEPFVGGGAVLCKKGYPSVTNAQHYREVINDHDEELVGLWRALRDDTGLREQLGFVPYSKAIHQDAKSLKGTPSDKPWAKFVRLAQSFSNKEGGGWGRSKVSSDRTTEKNCPSFFLNRIHEIPTLIERLRGVYIECDDALKVIESWGRSAASCVHADPPYPGTDQGHYAGYTVQDFRNLVDCLESVECSFVLSNYDQPDVTIPDSWQRIEVSAYSSAARTSNKSNGKRTEVLWVRDNSHLVAEDQQKYMWRPK